jgi:ubiquinone/menaquinone biosynthesis C-methylase UbiE
MPQKGDTMKMNWFEYFLMTFDPGRNLYLRGIVRQLRELSQLPQNQTILEIGCGNGAGTRFIREFFQPRQLIATELDERLVEIAALKNKDSNVTVEVGNATSLRFENQTFDAVIGLSVIHHIPNWRDCIDELHRILKPDGLLILKELSIETFESPFGRIARRFVEHPYSAMLKKNEFIEYIEKKGFAILDCRPHSMMWLLTDFLLVARKKRAEE